MGVGEDETGLGLIAPDQACEAGEPLAFDGEVELVGKDGAALDYDLGAARAEIANDAGKC